jgi:hypothetical protein
VPRLPLSFLFISSLFLSAARFWAEIKNKTSKNRAFLPENFRRNFRILPLEGFGQFLRLR